MTTQDNRTPEQIEADIERTQDEMSRTVDRLGDQFTPRNLMNALFDKAEENDIQARQLYDGARRNPLALGMIAGGLLWLVSDHDAKPSSFTSNGNGFDPDDYDDDYGDSNADRYHRSYVDHMAGFERLDNEDDSAYRRRRDLHRGNFLMIEQRHDEDESGFRRRLDEATDSMRTKRDDLAERARSARDSARSRGRAGMQKVKSTYRSDPLIGGALAAFAGLAAGLAAPASSREREMMGQQASRVLDTAKHKAEDAAQHAREKKDEAIDKAESRMQDANRSGTSASTGTTGDRATSTSNDMISPNQPVINS